MSPTLLDDTLLSRLTARQVRVLWIAYWIALFALMHTPREHLPRVSVSNIDKAVHAVGYALLGLLTGLAAQRRGDAITARWSGAWIVVFAAYAAVDEITQPLVNRSASVFDWTMDMLGITVAMFVIRFDSRRNNGGRE